MRVVIENAVFLNGGDAAIGLALMRVVQRAFGRDVTFTVFGAQSHIAQRLYPEIEFREELSSRYKRGFLRRGLRLLGVKGFAPLTLFERWRLKQGAESDFSKRRWRSFLLSEYEKESLRIYQSADMVVSTGGTYLVENYDISARAIEFYKDIDLKRPLILFTQSLGPFLKRGNRKAFTEIFNHADLILLRDQTSVDNISTMRINKNNVQVVADAAFCFAEGLSERRNEGGDYSGFYGARVAVSVRDWRHYDKDNPRAGARRYYDAIRKTVSMLVEKYNAQIVFTSTCQGIPEYWTSDANIAEAIASELPPNIRENVTVDNTFRRPEGIVEHLRGFDLVIATRLHMAILSLCAGVPVLPIAYEFKTRELFKSMGLKRWIADIDTLNAATLKQLCLTFIEHLPRIRAIQRDETCKQYESAVGTAELIREKFAHLEQPARAQVESQIRQYAVQ